MQQEKETIVLIHGLWMTPLCWEHWGERYRQAGYRVVASAWPGLDAPIADLRRNPSAIAGIGISDIVNHYESLIRKLERPPIIIGHSFGGLITQILLDRGLGSAGVAIAPAPAKGIIFLPFSTLKVSFPALSNPLNNHRAVALTPEQFHYAFTNTLTEEESLQIYERYAVPGPDHILFQAAFANFNPHAATMVDFANPDRAPLLLVAGARDHVSPPTIVHAGYKLYVQSPARTDYKEFDNRTHYILGQDGWEEVADYVLNWCIRFVERSVATATQEN